MLNQPEELLIVCAHIKLNRVADSASFRLADTNSFYLCAFVAFCKVRLELNVTTATGVGEFRLKVDGPGSATPLSQSFFLKSGIPEGEQLITVSLSTHDGMDDQGFPKTFLPGQYNFTFEVCQGECGSHHPHSKDFGLINGTFSMSKAIQV